MFKKFFQKIKYKAIARQLRKPGGQAGHKVGLMMNKANEYLYHFAWGCMNVEPKNKILEIGFGNGKFFEELSALSEQLELHGIDFSSAMVREATSTNEELIAAKKLQLHFGSSSQLPFEDNYFDKIFCINVIYFWDEPSKHLTEIKRVLKPGGKFFAVVRTRSSMEKMPFTQYGFTIYSDENWSRLVQQCGMKYIETVPTDEPEVSFEGKPFRVSSLCLIAEKS